MKALQKLTIVGIVVILISVVSVQAVAAMSTNFNGQQLGTEAEQQFDLSILDASTVSGTCDVTEPPLDLEALTASVPETPEATEAKLPPRSGRFILWTHDGVNVMWGRYGNGFFVGTDNHGVRVWGVYRQHVFAGFYGEQLFRGRYGNGRWIASKLFGQSVAYGQYRLFPSIPQIEITAELAT